ncbi:hypothetical protein [Streptomyces acidiscabies]|uniref:hypothetical protein n=1 Tax=Streptomyces acidiscabies TaxID=42234 RepID=UPI00117BE13A|nr:hypothetical protein [Streptomyces acidiscabies]
MRFIGFYREMDHHGLSVYAEGIPAPGSGVGLYPAQEVSRYLISGYPVLDVMEVTEDVICGEFRSPGGSSVMTDGRFVWRLDLSFYVQRHSISLPRDFLDFLAKNKYIVPVVNQDELVEISFSVDRALGFRADPGAGPRSGQGD